MFARKSVTFLSLAMLLVIALGSTMSDAGNRAGSDPKPSTYAPARDLIGQINEFMEQIEKDLADESAYGEDQQDRIAKTGNTLAVIALVLANHDDEVSLRAPSEKLIEASLKLAESAGNYGSAKAAFAEVQAVLRTSADRKPLAWESVADISELMLHVPILNTTLRRGVLGRRFASSREKAAALTATLAAIAHISIYDDTYCSDESEKQIWDELCVRMRDAAAKCNTAVHAGDQEKAKFWLTEMTRACDDCHDEFQE